MSFGTWSGRSLYEADSVSAAARELVRRGGMDWIKLAEDRDRWQAFVIAVMNLQFP